MALGAAPQQAVALLVRGPFVLIVTGLALGLPITFAISGILASQTFGGDPHLVVVETIATAVLVVTGFVAALLKVHCLAIRERLKSRACLGLYRVQMLPPQSN